MTYFQPLCSMRIGASAFRPRWNSRQALPPLEIRPICDRASLVHFISCLPNTWIGKISAATKKIAGSEENASFDYVLKMWLVQDGQVIDKQPPFALYYDKAFTTLQIYFKRSSWDPGLGGVLVQPIPEIQAINLYLPEPEHDLFSGSHAYSNHPYIVLGRRLESKWSDGVVDVSGRAVFSSSIPQSMQKRRERDTALHDFYGGLQNIGLGSVKIYASNHSGYAMKAITDDLYLYGLTAVFPWAIQMLAEICPNCTMLDATFRMMKPYILEILNVIIANESIPISIGVFPSETEQSYEFIYAHIEQILIQAQVANPAILHDLPLVSDQGSGLRAFANHRQLKWKHCHRHLIEAAGANSQIGDWVARLLQCASEPQYHRVAECIQCEIARLESIRQDSSKAEKILNSPKMTTLSKMLNPDGVDEMHTIEHWAKWHRFGCPSTSNASESIHAKLNAIAGEGRTFLARLSLVKKFLFRRFTQRNSPQRVHRRSSNRFLARMQSAEKILVDLKPDHDQFLCSLNTIVGNDQPIPNWLFPEFLGLERFTSSCITELVTFLPPDSWKMEMVAQVPQNPIEQHLAGMDDVDREAAIMIIQEGVHHEILGPEGEESLEQNDLMVEHWDESIAKSNEDEQQVKSRDKLMVLSRNDSTHEYHRIGWQIVFSVRRLVTQEQWQFNWTNVIDLVFTTGGNRQLDRQPEVNAQDEADWRMNVLLELQLL